MKHAHAMPFGAAIEGDAGALSAVGAGRARRGRDARHRRDDARRARAAAPTAGSRRASPTSRAGTRYAFRIDGGITVPDPASRFNPDDVHGASIVVDPLAYDWREDGWRGRPWEEAVIYELHVGSVHAGRHVRRGRSAGSTTSRSSASPRSS